MLSRLSFATAEKSSANSALATKLDPNFQTSATTCDEPECSNLVLVNLERNDNSETESDIDGTDTGSDTDSNYGIDFGEISEHWCESEAEICNSDSTSASACNFISTSAPLVNIPI